MIAVVAVLAFPTLAIGAGGKHGPAAKIGLSNAEPAAAFDAVTLPVASFHRAIRVSVRRSRAARAAALRRQREAYSTLPGGVSLSTLEGIAACESGGDPTIVSADGSYRGKYQFDYGTWESVGGSGDPAAAPEAEQDYRAALLYASSGSSPWPICG